jgi:ABC-type multidrug transport system, ATPase component
MIGVSNLRKQFGPKLAVDGISFSVEKGEVLGFLGPNGAGKSTTMRMITGFIPPDEGEVRVGSYNMLEQPIPARRLIGYLPENAPCYTDLTVLEFLNFSAELRGLYGEARRKAVARVAEMCFLENVLHQSVETLSKGYKHRTCFAQSLLHDPEVLILDEPTDGLDPNQKHEVRTLIRRMGEKKAIIFSTHILEEVEAVCTRAIIIDRGKIVANGTPDELKRRSPLAGRLTVKLAEGSAADVAKKLDALPEADGASVVSESPPVVTVQPRERDKPALAAAVSQLAARENWKLLDLHAEEGRLDDVFRSITLPDTTKNRS